MTYTDQERREAAQHLIAKQTVHWKFETHEGVHFQPIIIDLQCEVNRLRKREEEAKSLLEDYKKVLDDWKIPNGRTGPWLAAYEEGR